MPISYFARRGPFWGCVVAYILLASLALAQPLLPDATPDAAAKLDAATGLPAERFALAAAIDTMRRGHPLLDAVRATLQAAGGDVVAAGLWTNPVADAGYTRSLTHAQNDPLGAVGAGVTQFVETGRVPEARQAAAELARAAARHDLEAATRALQFDVESACLELAAAAAGVTLQAESLAELGRANTIVTARVRAGAAPEYDATRIGVAMAQSRAALAESKAQLQAARGTFDVAVGPRAHELIGLPQLDLFAPATPIDLAAALRQAGDDRPDLLAAARRAEAAQAQVEVARRQVRPGVAVRAGLYFGTSPGEFGGTVSVGVPLPVIDRGQGTIAAALGRQESAVQTAAALRLNATQRIEAAHREANVRLAAVTEFMQTGALRSKGMVQEAEAGYRAGKLSVLELVDAYLAKRDARQRAVELALGARQAELRLRRAVYAGTSLVGDPSN